jgi:hypothetical protein
MKQLISLIIISVTIASCNQNSSIESFSKRKYMPRFKQGSEIVDKAVRQLENSNNEGIVSVRGTKVDEVINLNSDKVKVVVSEKKCSEEASTLVGGCDELIKKDGTIIQAKISEIGITEIKYKKCDNAEGPTYVVSKSDIFMVKYANGNTEVITTEEKEEYVNWEPVDDNYAQAPVTKKGEPNALISFILSCIAIVTLAVPESALAFGIGGLVMSIIALSRQNKYKERYKSPGFALPAIIISGVSIVLAFFIIALLY